MITEEIVNEYLNRGMSVFPVVISYDEKTGKYEKKPAIQWREFITQRASQEEVSSWFAFIDFNALGMATGKISGISVVDVDDVDSHGFDSPVKVKTISGGHHYYFKHKDGVTNKARINGIPVDIRGDGGFVVIPPSECNGNKYEWESLDWDKLPSFPQIDIDPVYKPVMSELPSASSGNRNETAITVAGHMIANTKQAAWETTAWTAFKQWNETMSDPPMDERELRTTFESACSMQNRNHPESKLVDIQFGKNVETKYINMMKKWGDGLTTGYPELDEWFKLLPEQLYLISAPTFQGKTTLALNMSARIASFGHRVLFCSLEQGVFVAPRIKTMLGGDIPDGFGLMESAGLVTSEELINIVNQLSERPDLLVIDHLHFMAKNTKNGITGGIDEMMISIQNMAKNISMPVIVIAHLRKLNEDRAPTLDDLRDSSSLSQIPSVVMQLHRKMNAATERLDDVGQLLIRKNRIAGKTGSIIFKLFPSGEIKIGGI